MSDDVTPPDPPAASPDSLLGQLQRGRGAGFLRALDENPSTVHALLLECITHDPRWDSQVEDRADYYARLATLTQMDPAPLGKYLHTVPDAREDGDTFLTIETLGSLARRGSAAAAPILRDYIAYGSKWDVALGELSTLSDTEAHLELADVLSARFQTGQQMAESAIYGILNEDLDRLWQFWEKTHPALARLLNEARAAGTPSQPLSRPNYESFSVENLLAVADARNRRHIEKILLARLDAADVDQYVAAFSTQNPFAWRVAFECLAALKRDAQFRDMILGRVVSYLESSIPKLRGSRLIDSGYILQRLPPEMVLPLALMWLVAPEWQLRLTAEDILEKHATPDDIPRVRAALATALNAATLYDTDVYRACGALDILARFSDIGLLPEVEVAFLQSGYSFARSRAACAMQANAPVFFAETYAHECLWDCEEKIRRIGCESVALTIPRVRARLQALTEDPFEGDEVQEAAAKRLAMGR